MLDTSRRDWVVDFIANADNVSLFTLPAATSARVLSEYMASLCNARGGYILVGAYTEFGVNSGFQTVPSNVIKEAKEFLVNALYEIEKHTIRFETVYLLKIQPSNSIALSDGRACVIKDGKPQLMPEKALLNKLGLGVDSALINMLSKQITNQSSKLDDQSEQILILTQELQEKAKLKNQLLGLIVGGLIGAVIGWVLSFGLDRLFGIS